MCQRHREPSGALDLLSKDLFLAGRLAAGPSRVNHCRIRVSERWRSEGSVPEMVVVRRPYRYIFSARAYVLDTGLPHRRIPVRESRRHRQRTADVMRSRRLTEEQDALRLAGLRILARLIVRAHLASLLTEEECVRSGNAAVAGEAPSPARGARRGGVGDRFTVADPMSSERRSFCSFYTPGVALLPEDFPDWLTALKEITGLTWEGMACGIGVDPRQLQQWRRGGCPTAERCSPSWTSRLRCPTAWGYSSTAAWS